MSAQSITWPALEAMKARGQAVLDERGVGIETFDVRLVDFLTLEATFRLTDGTELVERVPLDELYRLDTEH